VGEFIVKGKNEPVIVSRVLERVTPGAEREPEELGGQLQ
jgi:hypothetical protein